MLAALGPATGLQGEFRQQLYDPRKDPIPSASQELRGNVVTVAAAAAAAAAAEEAAAGGGSIGGTRRRRRRDRRRRDGRGSGGGENEEGRGAPSGKPGHASRKLYNPASDSDSIDRTPAAAPVDNTERRQQTGTQRRGDRQHEQRTAANLQNRLHQHQQQHETVGSKSVATGKVILLKNPAQVQVQVEVEAKQQQATETASASRQQQQHNYQIPQVLYEIEKPVDSVEDIERNVRASCAKITEFENRIRDATSDVTADAASWWPAVRLHVRLLQEYEEYLLLLSANRHNINRLSTGKLPVQKDKVQSRMWNRGVSHVVGQLRPFLPRSSDALVSFFYSAYTIVSRLYEFLPDRDDAVTWAECLGDLARCRADIETDDSDDKHIWQQCAARWYTQCSFVTPQTGRLYHHLSLTFVKDSIDLAWDFKLNQIYYMCKSKLSSVPFDMDEGIMASLFGSVISNKPSYVEPAGWFARAHATRYTKVGIQHHGRAVEEFLSLMRTTTTRKTVVANEWNKNGVKYAIVNISGLYDYGAVDDGNHAEQSGDRVLSNAVEDMRLESDMEAECSAVPASSFNIRPAGVIAFGTLRLALQLAQPEQYAHVFVWLVFLLHVLRSGQASWLLDEQAGFPWLELGQFLSSLPDASFDDNHHSRRRHGRGGLVMEEDWALSGIKFCDDDVFEPEHLQGIEFEIDNYEAAVLRHGIGPELGRTGTGRRRARPRPRPRSRPPLPRQQDVVIVGHDDPIDAQEEQEEDEEQEQEEESEIEIEVRLRRLNWAKRELAKVLPQ
ncbi:hypothetical protein V1514DRAFT_324406 [Lipomyces japonicus]|uniref:uncharacterized protein n=1 Tax=Lipomyces japonicus TaxID=56871 RepID=UPI0034CD0210